MNAITLPLTSGSDQCFNSSPVKGESAEIDTARGERSSSNREGDEMPAKKTKMDGGEMVGRDAAGEQVQGNDLLNMNEAGLDDLVLADLAAEGKTLDFSTSIFANNVFVDELRTTESSQEDEGDESSISSKEAHSNGKITNASKTEIHHDSESADPPILINTIILAKILLKSLNAGSRKTRPLASERQLLFVNRITDAEIDGWVAEELLLSDQISFGIRHFKEFEFFRLTRLFELLADIRHYQVARKQGVDTSELLQQIYLRDRERGPGRSFPPGVECWKTSWLGLQSQGAKILVPDDVVTEEEISAWLLDSQVLVGPLEEQRRLVVRLMNVWFSYFWWPGRNDEQPLEEHWKIAVYQAGDDVVPESMTSGTIFFVAVVLRWLRLFGCYCPWHQEKIRRIYSGLLFLLEFFAQKEESAEWSAHWEFDEDAHYHVGIRGNHNARRWLIDEFLASQYEAPGWFEQERERWERLIRWVFSYGSNRRERVKLFCPSWIPTDAELHEQALALLPFAGPLCSAPWNEYFEWYEKNKNCHPEFLRSLRKRFRSTKGLLSGRWLRHLYNEGHKANEATKKRNRGNDIVLQRVREDAEAKDRLHRIWMRFLRFIRSDFECRDSDASLDGSNSVDGSNSEDEEKLDGKWSDDEESDGDRSSNANGADAESGKKVAGGAVN